MRIKNITIINRINRRKIMKKIIIAGGLLFTVLLLSTSLKAAESVPAVEEIIERANITAYYAGDDGRADVRMTITDAQGRTREREFVILRRDVEDGGAQKFYIYFKKPADVRKMVFMVHKHMGRDDDRWLYLPALDLVRRIAGADKRTSFVGSHFVYEDISGRGLYEDTHELTEVNDKYFVVKSAPEDADNVEFSSFTTWIDRQTYMPMRAEYLDKKGNKYRIVEVLAKDEVDGFAVVTRSRVQDIVNGGETTLDFTDIKFNIGLSEKIFTERFLRRPPREIRR